MKGRMPKHDAVRRGLVDRYQSAITVESRGVVMPDDIAQDQVQSEIWALIAPPVNTFSDVDIPSIRLLCFWYAVIDECMNNLRDEEGHINSDAINDAKKASTEIRAISDHLGLSPLSRSRIGLLQATTVKTAADTAAMFKSIDGAYGELA